MLVQQMLLPPWRIKVTMRICHASINMPNACPRQASRTSDVACTPLYRLPSYITLRASTAGLPGCCLIRVYAGVTYAHATLETIGQPEHQPHKHKHAPCFTCRTPALLALMSFPPRGAMCCIGTMVFEFDQFAGSPAWAHQQNPNFN